LHNDVCFILCKTKALSVPGKCLSNYRRFSTTIAFAALLACNSSTSETETKEDKKSAETSISDNPDYKAGLKLIAKSDCLTCHKMDEPLIGPGYRDVANKYASETPGIIPKLAEKIV